MCAPRAGRQIPGRPCKRVGDIGGRGEDGDRLIVNPGSVCAPEGGVGHTMESGLLAELRVCEGTCVMGVSARRQSDMRDLRFGYIFVGERRETEFFSVSIGFSF